MFALKAVPVLIIVVLLLSTNTVAQLTKDEWEKLVCAMFTGAKLSNENGLIRTDRSRRYRENLDNIIPQQSRFFISVEL